MVFVVALSCLLSVYEGLHPTQEEMGSALKWIAARVLPPSKNPVPFFSFQYNGKPSASLLAT